MNAFNILLDKFEGGDKKYYKTIPSFLTLYIYQKNIQNYLLSRKKFIFPGFTFEILNIHISSKNGCIAWSDIHKIYNKDNIVDAKALNPSYNKTLIWLLPFSMRQLLQLVRTPFLIELTCQNFLKLILCWWTIIANSKNTHSIF